MRLKDAKERHPRMAENLPLSKYPEPYDEALMALDPMELQRLFQIGAIKQDAHMENPEVNSELTPEECRFMITLTRILRRTNTGPAKAKTKTAKASKKATTQAAVDKLFDM